MDEADLEELNAFLSSERTAGDCMLLSDLDGFLTGIAVGPERVQPTEWLPIVWGSHEPAFADEAEAEAVAGVILTRYDEILRQIRDDDLNPIFWSDPEGNVIASDWAVGFMHAVSLRPDAWEKLIKSKRHVDLLVPIIALCSDGSEEPLPDVTPEEQEAALQQAVEFLPDCVAEIAAYWARRGANQIAMDLSGNAAPETAGQTPKVAPNDPCPCGSGKKFKKCCGANN